MVTSRVLKYDEINAPEHSQSVPNPAGISDINSVSAYYSIN